MPYSPIQYSFEKALCSKCGTEAWAGWYGVHLSCDCELGTRFKNPETGKFERVEVLLAGVKPIRRPEKMRGRYCA